MTLGRCSGERGEAPTPGLGSWHLVSQRLRSGPAPWARGLRGCVGLGPGVRAIRNEQGLCSFL